MRNGWVVVLGLGFAALLGACSSTSSGGSGSPGSNAAAAQCNALANKYCGKAASCYNSTTADCLTAFADSMKQSYGSDCSGADQVGASYDTCMSDLDSFVCGDSLPATCSGVILFQK